MEFGERYEGFLEPKQGPSPYITIDDPVLIKKKAEMREALREEYRRRLFNPYRQAAGIGGVPFDPMMARYNAMLRTQHEFYRPGPRFVSSTFFCFLAPFFLIFYFQEKILKENEYKYRTGQVAYLDRPSRKLW